jgi:tripartite-type tricarboxylate transporter receptor subunit TctC
MMTRKTVAFAMMTSRGTIVLMALGMAVALPAASQEMGSERGGGGWPSRPIRFVVPFPAGGSTDVAARVIGESLSRTLHQQIVVENKTGANGVFVPAGTPPAIAARLNAEIDHALADAAVRESFLQSALEPVGGPAAQFAQLVRDDYAKYARLVQQLNIKVN